MKTINVVAAIIVRGDQILATQRGYGDYEGGWEFPGGKIEEGEQPEEALVREIKEELAADIRIDKHVISVSHAYEAFQLEMACFACTLLDESVTLLEHEDARWLRRDELDSVDWLPADILVVDAVKDQQLI